jgi:hypothetical protein
MSRLRMMMLLLALAFVGALAIGGELVGQGVAAHVQAPANDGSVVTVTSWVHCGSVLSPRGNRPDTPWAYSDKSCAQKLARTRAAAWRWFAATVTVFAAAVLVAVLVCRGRSGQRRGTELASRPFPS